MRIVMLISIAVAWAVAFVAIAHQLDLILESRSNNVLTSPLLITAFTLSANNPTVLERLRRAWGNRNLMIAAVLVSACLVGGSLFAVVDTWAPRLDQASRNTSVNGSAIASTRQLLSMLQTEDLCLRSANFTAHSAGSDSTTAPVVAFRPKAASHRQIT
jgi:hypothetical protein